MSDYLDLIALGKSTKHAGVLGDANAAGEATNASCGDACSVSLLVEGGCIVDMRYVVRGCILSRAAAAVLTHEILHGCMNVPIGMFMQHTGDDIRAILGVPVSPLRERCLTTALAAVQNAINSYEA